MTIEAIINRLEKAKPNGPGRWSACCPAHKDRSPSMAVTELDDKRILIHCFAGCTPESILSAIGLTFDDLFPERLPETHKPARRPFNAATILDIVSREALVASVIANDLIAGKAISKADHARLTTAANRLNAARAMALE